MLYIDLIKYLEDKLKSHKLINVVKQGSIDNILNENNLSYPIGALSVTQPHLLGNPTSTYNFTVFYVDRLLQDNSNKNFIHNKTIKVFQDLIASLEDNYDIDFEYNNVSVELFTDRFVDECAGGWVNLSIKCATDYSECDYILLPTIASLSFSTEDGSDIINGYVMHDGVKYPIESGKELTLTVNKFYPNITVHGDNIITKTITLPTPEGCVTEEYVLETNKMVYVSFILSNYNKLGKYDINQGLTEFSGDTINVEFVNPKLPLDITLRIYPNEEYMPYTHTTTIEEYGSYTEYIELEKIPIPPQKYKSRIKIGNDNDPIITNGSLRIFTKDYSEDFNVPLVNNQTDVFETYSPIYSVLLYGDEIAATPQYDDVEASLDITLPLYGYTNPPRQVKFVLDNGYTPVLEGLVNSAYVMDGNNSPIIDVKEDRVFSFTGLNIKGFSVDVKYDELVKGEVNVINLACQYEQEFTLILDMTKVNTGGDVFVWGSGFRDEISFPSKSRIERTYTLDRPASASLIFQPNDAIYKGLTIDFYNKEVSHEEKIDFEMYNGYGIIRFVDKYGSSVNILNGMLRYGGRYLRFTGTSAMIGYVDPSELVTLEGDNISSVDFKVEWDNQHNATIEVEPIEQQCDPQHNVCFKLRIVDEDGFPVPNCTVIFETNDSGQLVEIFKGNPNEDGYVYITYPHPYLYHGELYIYPSDGIHERHYHEFWTMSENWEETITLTKGIN